MASSSHPLATEAALDMLRRGGSAADAYVAAAAVQTVVEPPMTTLGGGFYMNFFDAAAGNTTAVGGVFGAPAAEDGDWDEAEADTGRTACAPGWLNGARAAWRAYGRLGWAELFEHAHHHAIDGFLIDQPLWGWVFEYRYQMARFPEGQRLWYPDGHLLGVGDRLVQPDLARTIEKIQGDESLEWFYEGGFAERYVARVREDGGRLTMDDMAAHRGAEYRQQAEPIGSYRGHEIHSPMGYTVGLALQAVEHGDLRSLGRPTGNPETLYLLMRLVEEIWHFGLELHTSTLEDLFQARDDDNVLTSPETAAELWRRASTEPSRPYDPLHPGTNALVIVDGDGNVAFGTHSCSCRPFGNGHIVDGVWVSRPVLVYGQPAPLPVGLTTALLLAKDGKPVFAVGSPSISCVTNILQNTINMFEHGMTLDESVRQPMFGAPWFPSRRAMIEGDFPEAVYTHLRSRGMGYRRISPDDCEMGSCHGVHMDHGNGTILGVADPRRRGRAAGL